VTLMPEQAEDARKGERENIAAAYRGPEFCEPCHAFCVRGARKLAGVKCADRRAHQEIRFHSGR
jgi:hypothetical protein